MDNLTTIIVSTIAGLAVLAIAGICKWFFSRKTPKPISPNTIIQDNSTVIHDNSTVKNSNESHDGHAVASGQGNIAIGKAQNVSINQDNSNVQMPIEELNRRIELERKDAVEDTISDLPESVKKAHERIDNIETILTYKGNKTGNSKLAEARKAHQLGMIAKKENRWIDAMKHYTLLAKIHPTFIILTHTSDLAQSIGDYSSALSFALKAEKAAAKEYGEDSKEYANSLNSLAMIHNTLEEYKKAELLCERALKIYKNLLGDRNSYFAHALNTLAISYDEQLDILKATPLYKEVLEIRQEVLGKEHRDTASSLYNLGLAYSKQFEYEKAEPFFNEALAINKKVFGENHRATATSLRGLALLYHKQERFTESESYYKQALEIFRKEPVRNKIEIAYCLNNLAWLYLKIGRHYESIPLYEEAIKILEDTLGHDHTNTSKAKSNLEVIQKHIANQANTEKTTPQ